MNLQIRDYAAADRPSCLAIFDSNVPDSFTAPERLEFEAFLDDLLGPYFVVTDESGSVVACGGYAVEPGTTRADLCWGMVLRGRQREGLGRVLTQLRLNRIVADDRVTEVALRTSHLTLSFYERFGFVVESVVPDGIASGQDLCQMRLRIARQQLPH